MKEKLKKYFALDSQEILDELSVGVIICNNLFEIIFINKTFFEIAQFYELNFEESGEIKNLFDIKFFNEDSIKQELSSLQKGLPFENEISSSDFSKRGLIKLILKATPLMENGVFGGAIFIIEDLRVAIETTTEYIKRNADLQKVIEQSSDFFVIIDKENNITQYSVNIPINIKDEISKLENPYIFNIIHPEDQKTINYYLNYAKLEKKLTRFVIRLKNGFEYSCKIIPVTNRASDVNYCYIFFDKIESKLLSFKSNLIFQTPNDILLKQINLNYILYDKDFNVIEISESFREYDNQSSSEVKSEKVFDRFNFIKEEVFQQAEVEISKHQPFRTKAILETSNRKKKIFRLTFYLVDNDKRILLIDDITSYELEEQKLKNKISIYENTLNNSEQMILILKLGGEIIFANNSFCDNTGYERKTLLSRSFYSLIDPNYLEKNVFDLSAFSQRKTINLELPLVKLSGEKITVQSSFNPIKLSEGALILLSAYFTEYEKLKSKEIELKFYTSIIQNSFDGIALLENSKFIKANISFLKMFGFETENELEEKSFLDLISDDDTIRVSEFIRLVELNKLPPGKIDFTGRRTDGSKINVELSVSLSSVDSRKILVLSARDITEKIKSHRELRESEEKYRTSVENIEDCLFLFEKVGFGLRPVFCSSAIKNITGYSVSDFLSDSKFLFRIAHPDDFKKVKPKLDDILKSKIKKSGELDFRIINKEGNIVWVSIKLSLQRSISGNIQKVHGLLSDVTITKKNEEELIKANSELKILNETKDRFISIISHDLRTPFTSILGFTDILLNDEGLSDAEKKQYIKFINESAQTMFSLVNSVLDWTRIQTGRVKFEPVRTNVTEIINQAINALSGAALKKSIKISNQVNREIYLYVDKNLIIQVFYNLISNAIKFTRENGKIEISATPNSNFTYYYFSVKDDGVGIKPEDMNKLFSVDSKFTTEGTYGEKGSGLGLSLVKEIIEKHNGKIWVESQYGKGSNFQFSIPISSTTILILEPENAERMLISKIIKNFKPDFNIQSEMRVQEALHKIKQLNPPIVLINHYLDEKTGIEFIKEVFKLNLPNKIQFIVLASNLDKALADDYSKLGVEFILNKPINVNYLQQAIEKSLIKSFQKTKF
ncbi:MAG: PAS domain S-box protein [Ignavibacterium sp.]|nr:PAS domain S-box protein [Ignavibacterium sp.]